MKERLKAHIVLIGLTFLSSALWQSCAQEENKIDSEMQADMSYAAYVILANEDIDQYPIAKLTLTGGIYFDTLQEINFHNCLYLLAITGEWDQFHTIQKERHKMFPNDPGATMQLGMCAEKFDSDLAGARKLYTEANEKFIDQRKKMKSNGDTITAGHILSEVINIQLLRAPDSKEQVNAAIDDLTVSSDSTLIRSIQQLERRELFQFMSPISPVNPREMAQ